MSNESKDFPKFASMSQTLKDVMRSGENWEKFSDSQREAMEMIARGLAHVLMHDKDYRPHWNDVAAFANIGAEYTKSASMPSVTLDLTKAMGGE